MTRLPDRFDLWVRKARECQDPARQVDYILGAMAGLKEWYFLNTGTKENPQCAKTRIGPDDCFIVFSDPGRIEDLVQASLSPEEFPKKETPVITIPTAAAMAWCVENRAGLLVNPRDEGTVLIPFEQVEAFHAEWSQRGGRQAAGFWIPNMTTEEEDFWQEHGY
jgi:hypothetical protein